MSDILINADQGYVVQGRSGNFVVERRNRRGQVTEGGSSGVTLTRQQFARIFGRIPPNGISLRGDVFLRLARLAGLKIGFSLGVEPGSNRSALGGPFPKDELTPLIQTWETDREPNDEAFGLFLNDEGNFNLRNLPHGSEVPSSFCLTYPRFETMFGLDVRDYFANEAIRIATLGGLQLTIRSSKE